MFESIDERVELLLVDDREDGLIALEAVLSDFPKYDLVSARSGFQALDLMEHHDFAVILLDVQMPGIDGFETARRIRSQPRYAQIPIVFVTAINKDERYVYQGYEAGAVDYIFKPFDPMILKCKVNVFVELQLKTRRLQAQARLMAERDALERRAQIQAVELENLRRYRNLADSIPHIVLRLRADGDLEYSNRLWSEYTGLKLTESQGVGWQAAVDEHDLQSVLGRWYEAMRNQVKYEAEFRLRRADGAYRWHWVKASPELDDAGHVIAWLATCTDIQERKTTEEELKAAQTRAELASQAKTQFLANMSHEIRTPLNAIIGFTELLVDSSVTDDEREQGVAIIRRNGHQLMRIVDEILDISKVEAGGLELERTQTPFPELWNEQRALMAVEAAKKAITCEFVVEGPVPSLIETDSTRFRQILLNVIGNAIKFTRVGRVRARATFRPNADRREALVTIEVTDSGVGIDAANGDKIFQPFSQADSSTTRLFGGTGLGLPLSRKLAQALGGDVRLIKSRPGQGSTFEITVVVQIPTEATWTRLPADDFGKPDRGPREVGL